MAGGLGRTGTRAHAPFLWVDGQGLRRPSGTHRGSGAGGGRGRTRAVDGLVYPKSPWRAGRLRPGSFVPFTHTEWTVTITIVGNQRVNQTMVGISTGRINRAQEKKLPDDN